MNSTHVKMFPQHVTHVHHTQMYPSRPYGNSTASFRITRLTVLFDFLQNAPDHVGSILTRGQDGRPRFDCRRGRKGIFFSSPPHPDRLWRPPSLLSNGHWSSVEVKNAWSYTSTPHTSSWSGTSL